MPVLIKTGMLKYKDPATGEFIALNQAGEDFSDIIASEYSELTFPVDKGALCIQNGSLYAAKQSIPASEEWNAEHWDSVTIAEELDSKEDKAFVAKFTLTLDSQTNKWSASCDKTQAEIGQAYNDRKQLKAYTAIASALLTEVYSEMETFYVESKSGDFVIMVCGSAIYFGSQNGSLVNIMIMGIQEMWMPVVMDTMYRGWGEDYIANNNKITSLANPTAAQDAATKFYVDTEDAKKLTAPATAGTQGQVLTSDGQGGQSWQTPSSGTITDVQLGGTSIIVDGVANIPPTGASKNGYARIDSAYGVNANEYGRLYIQRADDSAVKAGTNQYRPIVPLNQYLATFYGLAKAAGADEKDSTLPVGQYTDTAKEAIRSMIGAENGDDIIKVQDTQPTEEATKIWLPETPPSGVQVPTVAEMTSALDGKVDKDAIDNAGITARTYSLKFGGEFTVTTATTSGYLNPYARASVTGRINKENLHRVTVNGTEYILPTRLWYMPENSGIKVYEYLGNLGLYISSTSGVPGGTDNVPFVIISDLNNSNSIDVLTQSAGTYTIKVEQINNTQKRLPTALIYGDSYAPIEKNNNGGTYNGFSIGVNELNNKRATFAFGYGNKIDNEFSHAIGHNNKVSASTGLAIGENNTIASGGLGGKAIGYSNTVSGDDSIALGNDLIANGDNMVAIGKYNVEANTSFPSFTPNTQYHKGDVVNGYFRAEISTLFTMVCQKDHISANTQYFVEDTDPSTGLTYWLINGGNSDTVFVIGNGTGSIKRSNALKIDYIGNGKFNGDVYVNCNADSSGGTKLATVDDVASSAVEVVRLI